MLMADYKTTKMPEQLGTNPQVSVYDFAEIMKGKEAEAQKLT